MAQIALGIGTSHAPQLSTPPQEWGQRARADHRNPALAFRGGDYSFAELSELRNAAFAGECEPALQADRHRRSRAAIDELGRIVGDAGLDVLVVVSSDHKETFGDELLPQFAVYWGETCSTSRSPRRTWTRCRPGWPSPRSPTSRRTAPRGRATASSPCT